MTFRSAKENCLNMYDGQRGKLVESFKESYNLLLLKLMMTAKTKFSSGNGDGVYFGLEKYCIYPAHSVATTVLECDGNDEYPSVCEFNDTPCNHCLKDFLDKQRVGG